jgi:hypothetical protein
MNPRKTRYESAKNAIGPRGGAGTERHGQAEGTLRARDSDQFPARTKRRRTRRLFKFPSESLPGGEQADSEALGRRDLPAGVDRVSVDWDLEVGP